jgi:hypothetical protein
MVKFKREVVRCTQEKRESAAILGVDESNIRLWQKHKVAINEWEASPKKG